MKIKNTVIVLFSLLIFSCNDRQSYPENIVIRMVNMSSCYTEEGSVEKIKYTYADNTEVIKYLIYKSMSDFQYIKEQEALRICNKKKI